jgi:hypothetical protein
MAYDRIPQELGRRADGLWQDSPGVRIESWCSMTGFPRKWLVTNLEYTVPAPVGMPHSFQPVLPVLPHLFQVKPLYFLPSPFGISFSCDYCLHLQNAMPFQRLYSQPRSTSRKQGFWNLNPQISWLGLSLTTCFLEITSNYLQLLPARRRAYKVSSFHIQQHNPDSSSIKCIY